MGIFSKKSTNTSQTYAETRNTNIQDNQGLAIAGNQGRVTITDGGAIRGSLALASYGMDLAGDMVGRGFDLSEILTKSNQGFALDTLDGAAGLTMALVGMQADAGKATLDSARKSAEQGYKFAMDAGRSEVATMQDTTQKILLMVGLIAAAWVIHGWATK